MKVQVIPPIRIKDELAVIGSTYLKALFEIAAPEGGIKSLYDEWNQTGRPANHRFNDICDQAKNLAVKPLLPSERRLVSFIHEYE